MSKKTLIEKDIKSTIRLLRFLTHGEGYSAISVFDGGAGGGFGLGTLSVNLERSGLILKSTNAYTTEELFSLIKSSLYPYGMKTIEEINEIYKKISWDK